MEGPQVDKLAGGDCSPLNERASHEIFPELSRPTLKAFSKDSLMNGSSSKSSSDGRSSAPKQTSQISFPCWKSSSCFSIDNSTSSRNQLRGPIHSMSHIMSEQDLITEWEGMTASLNRLFSLRDLRQTSSRNLHCDGSSKSKSEISQSSKTKSDRSRSESVASERSASKPSSPLRLVGEKIPPTRGMSEVSLKSTCDDLNSDEFRSQEELEIIAEIKRIQEILNNSLVNVDSVTKASNIMKRRQTANSQETDSTQSSTSQSSAKGPQLKPRVLWALTKVSIFPDDSRTYEVMKLTDKKPSGMPEKLDSVFVLVAPK